MKKIIFVIALCILNLTVIMPRSFKTARNHISESYTLGVIHEAEVSQRMGLINKIETGIKISTYTILVITFVLGIQAIFKGKDKDSGKKKSPLTEELTDTGDNIVSDEKK